MSEQEISPPTEVLDQAPTQIAPPRAWSAEGETGLDMPPYRRRGWAKYGLIAAALIAAGAVASAVLLAQHEPKIHGVQDNLLLPQAPTTPPLPPMSPDDRFVQTLAAGFPPGHVVKDRQLAIKEGHWLCNYLADGHTQQETLDYLNSSQVSMDAATQHRINEAGLHAALTVYCPEFSSPQARDDAFTAALNTTEIVVDSRTAVNNAHHVCQSLNSGVSRADVTSQIRTEGLTGADVAQFVTLAVKFYCPQNQPPS